MVSLSRNHAIINFSLFIDSQVKVIKFKGDPSIMQPNSVFEIRGIVNKDNSISFGELTQYDNEFDLGMFEQMCVFYHGMCKDLCVR